MATFNSSIPGTLRLLDEQGAGGQVVLQPRPTADPEDPLNWAPWRKRLAIGMVYLYTFGIGIATAVQYSVLTQIAEAQDLTVGQLNLGTGLMFLFLGWGCLIWQPFAMAYGRRGVYITSIVLSIIPMVWAPYSTGAGQWYAHRSLLGLLASPVESLPEVSVPDLFFAHERGSYMALYAFVLFGSNFLAPFFAGFINDGVGWHWVMHFGSITLGVCAVVMFFLMEETMYFRTTAEGGSDDDYDTKQKTAEVHEMEGQQGEARHGEAPRDFAPPQTYLQKLRLAFFLPGRPTPKQTAEKSWRALVILVFFPNVLWAGFLYGANLSLYNVMNATMSIILGGAPYNFTPTQVGLAYLSPFAAGAVTCLWAGWVADKTALHLARRNGGIREPEQRLWPLAISGVLCAAGLILWGVGASRGVHFMGLIIGIAFVTFGVVAAGGMALAYSVDCFKEIAGETMISVIIVRNTMGFAFNYAITPWLDALGTSDCFISVSMIALFCTFTFLAMVVWGRSLRKWSASRYWRWVAQDQGRSIE